MQALNIIIDVIGYIFLVLSVLYFPRVVYAIVGFFTTRKFEPAKTQHKYAILIAARNEENVIKNLIESIKRQDYPEELVTVFVVADNCTDNTATIARENGAICYERFDSEHRTKGFALQFLVERIRRDYGIHTYEAYMIFDADNLLKGDFISRMNDSFDAGEKIVTSYRNTKNFGDNWISASYGLHWLRTVLAEHKPRSFFKLATRIQGTGFLFASEIIDGGWNYTSLTEDRAFCADAVVQGYKISYNHEAEFYDEQPIDIKTAMRQRIRWAKGHLQGFVETGWQLFTHIFRKNKTKTKEEIENDPALASGARFHFMSFDMLSLVFPYGFACFLRDLVVFILEFIVVAYSLFVIGPAFFPSIISYAPTALKVVLDLFGIRITVTNELLLLALFVVFCFASFVFSYLSNSLVAAYVFIMERKRIPHISLGKKIWFCLTFPIFDLIGKISNLIACLTKVEWKPIKHGVSKDITEIEKTLAKK